MQMRIDSLEGDSAVKPRDIQRDEWSAFFDNFTRKHAGWTITLEIIGTEIGAQIQDRELVFEGIVIESKEESAYQIMIMAGELRDGHITHRIARPVQVSYAEDEQSSGALIMIKAADAIITLLKLRAPASLEVVASNQALAAKV
jgi:hypothetical protein